MDARFVFLDFDGVVHPAGQVVPLPWSQVKPLIGTQFFLPGSVTQLRSLCLQTGARIVVTSTWRLEFPISVFQPIFGDLIVGSTPLVSRIPAGMPMRWMEIQAFLADQDKPSRYVIIDDQAGLFPLDHPRTIITDPRSGFLEGDFELALSILLG
ncbi:HAD domain-containing protein [Microbulbifer sp. SA54]|uniref:HAD domain-containing protein n=1 Tax=Microbulbifer sp. SA54 TaxID=3401577 RepID=UPI003AAB8422